MLVSAGLKTGYRPVKLRLRCTGGSAVNGIDYSPLPPAGIPSQAGRDYNLSDSMDVFVYSQKYN